MKRILILIAGWCICAVCLAQNTMKTLLWEIEQNNPDLQAAAAALDRERFENRSEALLADPEVEFNYLWGAAGIGDRHDVRITQSFDLPTLSGKRSGKAASLDELSALDYEAQRLALRQEARSVCIDLVYYSQLLKELTGRLARTDTLVRAYERRMRAGGATILDLNKAKLSQASVQGQFDHADNERKALWSRLLALNGGREPGFSPESYDPDTLPADFDSWFAEAAEKNPVLAYVREEVALEEQQLAIDRQAMMPELTVGYMSEIRTAEKFRGVTVGLNIPLWSSANRVRRSRAGVAAAKSRQDAAEQEFCQRLRDLYRQAAALKDHAAKMRASLADADYRDYLLTALTRGEISMIDYLVEMDLYNEALEQALNAEREYRHALAALEVF